ncbi:hypothetical protein ABPG73_023069 [Tetrahymena malaccensis]
MGQKQSKLQQKVQSNQTKNKTQIFQELLTVQEKQFQYQQFIKQCQGSVIIEKQNQLNLNTISDMEDKSLKDIVLIKIEPTFEFDIKKLSNYFRKCPNLVYLRLNLFNKCMGDQQAIILCNSFNKCKNISYLELNIQNKNPFEFSVQDSGILELAKSISLLQGICFLNLAINQFTKGETIHCLGKAISKLTNLKNLILDFGHHPHDDIAINSEISNEHDQGFVQFFKELYKCSNLRTIELSLDYLNPTYVRRRIKRKFVKLASLKYVRYDVKMYAISQIRQKSLKPADEILYQAIQQELSKAFFSQNEGIIMQNLKSSRQEIDINRYCKDLESQINTFKEYQVKAELKIKELEEINEELKANLAKQQTKIGFKNFPHTGKNIISHLSRSRSQYQFKQNFIEIYFEASNYSLVLLTTEQNMFKPSLNKQQLNLIKELLKLAKLLFKQKATQVTDNDQDQSINLNRKYQLQGNQGLQTKFEVALIYEPLPNFDFNSKELDVLNTSLKKCCKLESLVLNLQQECIQDDELNPLLIDNQRLIDLIPNFNNTSNDQRYSQLQFLLKNYEIEFPTKAKYSLSFDIKFNYQLIQKK